jgi:steroid 5-alpha reductase family enzyme
MLWLAALALVSMVFVMSCAWAVQRQQKNAGWVDAFWSGGTGLTGAVCALIPWPGLAGPSPHAWLVVALALAWSGRLAVYIARRTATATREDARYARFRQEWGEAFESRLYVLLMIQAMVAALLAICIMLAARNQVHQIRPLDIAATLLLAGAVLGETISDRQMHRFRSDPANRGRVCEAGLWGWSRHPNYFFECLGWFAYPLFAFHPDAPGFSLLALAGPLSMVWLLTRVSGIPPLELEMIDSRPDAYRAYQARVSAFLPLPPRPARGVGGAR